MSRMPVPKSKDADMVRSHMRDCIHAIGSQAHYAACLGISESFLSDVLSGRREPSKKLLDALGLERVVYYEEKRT